jgi:hypothetical protein
MTCWRWYPLQFRQIARPRYFEARNASFLATAPSVNVFHGFACQSQSKKGPLSRGKKGPFRVMFVWRFGARARHKAEACQSACWPLGRHCSELGGAGLLSGFATVFEAIAFAVHLKDLDVMG